MSAPLTSIGEQVRDVRGHITGAQSERGPSRAGGWVTIATACLSLEKGGTDRTVLPTHGYCPEGQVTHRHKTYKPSANRRRAPTLIAEARPSASAHLAPAVANDPNPMLVILGGSRLLAPCTLRCRSIVRLMA
jgi:hypothetical protein